ncbi:DUF5060 domain-containing protein, partial [Candidatus Poribacteria bacterium]|nr:DUF5060 domain-containing protein [Candidatus Poribacteria bacterium]
MIYFISVLFFTLTSAKEVIMLNIMPPENQTIAQYGKFQVAIEAQLQYNNPFSPEEVDLRLHILTPSGLEHIMPAFYDEEKGQPSWKVRYAPMEVGTYRYYAKLKDFTSKEFTFECVSSKSDGFIRLSPDDYRYFQFDSGKPYFAVGHNVCWADDYEYYFKKMAAYGENYTRIWMIHWNVALEWTGNDYPGLGRYHIGKAKRLDRILEMAEKYGIYIMLCIDSFNTLRIKNPYPAYQGNPYAKENGGMLERPEQFFTNSEAIRLFKQRLRYIVARYSYSPSILCWEFWNEVDIIEKYISPEVVKWHEEMAKYLRHIDPMKHPITTSFAYTQGDSAIWKMPEMEISQNHLYNSKDMAESISYWTKRNINEFKKPHIFGEFGTDAGGPGKEKDPEGIALHNGIWAATLSGSAGTAMLWWWDSYIDPLNLYYHFKPLAEFVKDIEWPRASFRDLQIGNPNQHLRIYGLQNDTEAILWLQNSQHTWYRSFNKEPIESILPVLLEIRGLKNGDYQIQWWDTYEMKPIVYDKAKSINGILKIKTPEIPKDIACKIQLH